jgi:hypothetical protein
LSIAFKTTTGVAVAASKICLHIIKLYTVHTKNNIYSEMSHNFSYIYRLFKKIEMPKLFCYVYGFEIKIHLMFDLIPPLIIVLYNVSIGNHIV